MRTRFLSVITVIVFVSVAITTPLLLKKTNDLINRIEYNAARISMEGGDLDSLTRALIKNRVIGSQNGYNIFDSKTVLKAIDFKQMETDISDLQDHLLSFIVIKWLTLETRAEFGTDRRNKALDLSVKEINLMLKELIPDPAKRSDWIQAMREMLPKKNKPATTTDK